MMPTLLNLGAVLVVLTLVVSLVLILEKGVRLVLAGKMEVHKPVHANQSVSPSRGWTWPCSAFQRPIRNFHARANLGWTLGYCLYHAALALLLAGYGASAVLLAVKMITGVPIPEFFSGQFAPQSYTPANVLVLIFGNAESIPSRFLFGDFAAAFRVMSACEVAVAALGNLCLLLNLLSGRHGAICADLDAPSRGIRRPGAFSWQHLGVRLLIFSIIWMEIAVRLGASQALVYVHALAGLGLLGLASVVYLRHVFFAPLAVFFSAAKQWRGGYFV